MMLSAVVLTAAAAVIYPIAIYALTLAVFGWPHVATEWRYVCARFGARLTRPLILTWGIALLILVIGRAAMAGHLRLPWPNAAVEVSLLAVMSAATLPLAAGRDFRRGLTAVLLTVAFASAFLISPAIALGILAFLHNLTPLGFLAERFTGRERRRVLGLASIVFIAAPIGVFFLARDRFDADLGAPLISRWFGGFGVPEAHFASFMPARLIDRPIALGIFAAAAYLQCAHYAVVLHVLPRLLPEADRPRSRRTDFLIGAVAVFLTLYFMRDFAAARALYAVAAGVHAWIEWPLFAAIPLLAAAPARPPAAREAVA